MPRFTRKRGGAPRAAYKTRNVSRKVLGNRNRRGSRAAAILENMGIIFSRSYVPPPKVNTKKTRTRAAAAPPRKSLRAVKLAVNKASRQLAKEYANAAANTAAESKKLTKATAKLTAAEQAKLEKLREEYLLRMVTKNHPVIAPSSLTHSNEHEKHLKNYRNAMKELKEMRSNRAPKARASRSRAAAINLGGLELGPKLTRINENNENAPNHSPGTPRYH